MATVWIILVNWNGGVDTIECLESLLRLQDMDWRVVIVDNGSSDDSITLISKWAASPSGCVPASPLWDQLPAVRRATRTYTQIDGSGRLPPPVADITLIAAGQNLGFAAANNLGMNFAAQDPDARYYWILNNDTVVEPMSLGVQRRRMDADSGIGMLGARLMFYAEPTAVQGLAGGFHRWLARGYHLGLGLKAGTLPSETEVEEQMAYVLGASMFVRRMLVDAIGGMSEDYFLYFEEIDWARRLPSNYSLAVAHDAVVWHKEGKAIGSATRARPSETSLYYINAGLLRFYAKHDRALLLIVIARIVREGAGYLIRRDYNAAKAVFRGAKDAISGIHRRGRYNSPEFTAAGDQS